MAYFNHAFNKTFIADSTLATAATATSALTSGQVALVDGSTWASVALPGGAITTGALGYLVQGSFYTKDSIGNNPGHGGYQESVKSKGINPKYITRLWKTNCITAAPATASLSLGSACTPCGTTQFMRMDVKGSPALRFLNHNAYAIADSANICCATGQTYLDPALVLATMGNMMLADPLIKPFVAEAPGVTGITLGVITGTAYTTATGVATTGGTGTGLTVDITAAGGNVTAVTVANPGSGYTTGDVIIIAQTGSSLTETATLTVTAAHGVAVNVAGVITVYTIAEVLDGTYVASVDPVGDDVSATINFVGAYVNTKFGNCSFDTRDHFNSEPVEIIPSLLDETGDPCNDCGTAVSTPGVMQQTQGEDVIRDLIMSESYRQSPYNQGNPDSARIREIEMSDELLAAVDRNVTYKAYYIQHTVPRFNNPTGVFDNEQYVYKIYVKCSDTSAQTELEALFTGLVTWAAANGNTIALETNAYW